MVAVDGGGTRAALGLAQHLALTLGQGVAFAPRFSSQVRVDAPPARVNPADGIGQFGSGRVFQL